MLVCSVFLQIQVNPPSPSTRSPPERKIKTRAGTGREWELCYRDWDWSEFYFSLFSRIGTSFFFNWMGMGNQKKKIFPVSFSDPDAD